MKVPNHAANSKVYEKFEGGCGRLIESRPLRSGLQSERLIHY
jgi:hypothetical protein